jgi:hypothetical protein
LAWFKDIIGDMLCNINAALRSLSNDENITFLLSGVVKADEDNVNGSHDKVYVFKQKDVKSCVMVKSDKNKLLIAPKTYLF